MMSRRAFLGTMAASLATAAVYDPKTLLWMPEEKSTDIVLAATSADITAQLELNDLAARVARAMSERLELHPSVGLSEVVYRYTGAMDLPKGLLGVLGVGPGYLKPTGRHMLSTDGAATPKAINSYADALSTFVKDKRIDMFAPISADLRPGEPFSPDVKVGRATDPETGLSVRAMRFEQAGVGWWTSYEIAGGRWQGPRLTSKQLATATALCALSTFGDESDQWADGPLGHGKGD